MAHRRQTEAGTLDRGTEIYTEKDKHADIHRDGLLRAPRAGLGWAGREGGVEGGGHRETLELAGLGSEGSSLRSVEVVLEDVSISHASALLLFPNLYVRTFWAGKDLSRPGVTDLGFTPLPAAFESSLTKSACVRVCGRHPRSFSWTLRVEENAAAVALPARWASASGVRGPTRLLRLSSEHQACSTAGRLPCSARGLFLGPHHPAGTKARVLHLLPGVL